MTVGFTNRPYMERTATVTFWDGVLLFKILPFIDLCTRHGGWLRAVDGSIVEAPSSIRNATGERDPEMRQTKKGDQWHFGMKVHAAVNVGTVVFWNRAAGAAPRGPR